MRFGFLDVVEKFFPQQAEGLNPVAFFLFKIGCFGELENPSDDAIRNLLRDRYNYFSTLNSACKSLIERVELAISGIEKSASPRSFNDYHEINRRLNWFPKEPQFKNKIFDAVVVVLSSDNSIVTATQSLLLLLKNKSFAVTEGNFFIQSPSASAQFDIKYAETFLGSTLAKFTSGTGKETCQLQRLQKLSEYSEILVASSDSMIEELTTKLEVLGEDNKTPKISLFDKRAFIEVAPTTDVLISIIKEKVLDPMIQYGIEQKFVRLKREVESPAPTVVKPKQCYAPTRASSLRNTMVSAEISL